MIVEPLVQSFFSDPSKTPAPMPTREAFGKALLEIGGKLQDIVVVDADLGKSTFAILFGRKYPERWIECGAAEQNMMGIAAGLAAAGKIPFATTFAVFATGRAFDQIRVSIAQPKLNVKIVASHAGLTVGEDGKSAQALEDLSLMCSLPGFTVIVPADPVETAQAVEAAVMQKGPFYIRTGRSAVPFLYGPDYRFTLGKAVTMRDGRDATIIAIGVMVKAALDAAEALATEGVSCRVLNMPTIKPIDAEAIIAAAEETGAIVTAEEHLEHGGLGSIVASTLVRHRPVPMEMVAVKDMYGQSGKPQELLDHYGLTSDAIAGAVRSALERKRVHQQV
ncbi:MAG: Transketolase central region [Dehalococcoidia bacterium]|nr:Transketolase central region [Dehalococcoidia bacterium]